MAADTNKNKDVTIRRHNGESYDTLLPTTHMGQVYTDNTLTTTLDEHLTNVYAPITDLDMLEDKKADKTALDVTNQNIVNLQNDKADKNALAVTNQNIETVYDTLNNDKVDKTQTIMGLDFKDNITRTEVVDKIGEATQILSGLMSVTDKQRLDALHALLGVADDADNVVNTINEIMEIFETYPEGANILETLNGKVDKVAGKQLSTNDLTDTLKDHYDTAYAHSQIKDKSNPHNTSFANITDKPTTRDGFGITDVYTKPETYTQQEINALFDNLSAVKGLKSTLLTPTELSNGDTISTNLLTNNGAYIVFTATDTLTKEIDSDTVPVSTIKTGKKFVFFDNQEIVFAIGSTTSTFQTTENITLKINLLFLDSENVQAIGVDFDGSLTNYLLSQTNVQEAIEKIDNELKTTNDNIDETEANILALETANMIKSITRSGSNLFTITYYDDTTSSLLTLAELKSFIGEATQSLSGLMSAQDKVDLDTLMALFDSDGDSVVNNIQEILDIFENYPEGADLVTALAGKVDKNNAITAGTKTKITYDAKGLVIKGEDLDATDIPPLPRSKIDGLATDLNSKVDKIEGKGLSTEDYTTNEKNKLAELAVGFNVDSWFTATKTLALSDANKLILCSYTDNQTLIIPSYTTVLFPIGTTITFLLTSPSTVTFSGASGVTLMSIDSLVELKTQHGMASLIKTDTNTWQLVGDLGNYYTKTEIDSMIGDIETALDAILGV